MFNIACPSKLASSSIKSKVSSSAILLALPTNTFGYPSARQYPWDFDTRASGASREPLKTFHTKKRITVKKWETFHWIIEELFGSKWYSWGTLKWQLPFLPINETVKFWCAQPQRTLTFIPCISSNWNLFDFFMRIVFC